MRQHLLVEGQNDLHVILNLWNILGLKPVKDYNKDKFAILANGKDNLPLKIAELLASSDIENIGIVLDADRSAQSTWQSICSELAHHGFENLPKQPLKEGFVIKKAGFPTIGIWIMPDNQAPFEKNDVAYLEHFYATLVKIDDKFLIKAKHIIEDIVTDTERRFPLKDKQKAIIHTWLAWQEEPGSAMGHTLKNRNLFDLENELAIIFKKWLEETFELKK